jgi:regulatory protein
VSEHGSTSRRRRSSSEPSPRVTESSEPDRSSPGDPYESARGVVLRQLTAAPRTRRQLEDALTRRGIPKEVGRAVLDRFAELDLVDDEAFAKAWVDSRHRGRGLARRALSYELRHRGVADDVAREALAELSPEDELAMAREVVRKRLAGTRGDDPQRRIRRLAGVLARKGYGPQICVQAVREVLGEEAEGLEELAFEEE